MNLAYGFRYKKCKSETLPTCKSSPQEGIGMRLNLPTTKSAGMWKFPRDLPRLFAQMYLVLSKSGHRGGAYLKSPQRIIATKTLMPPGAPRPMKIGRPYALPEEHDRMPPKGLGVRSCSDWCPEPVTKLDLDTCRHHPLSPASPGKPSTQGSLSCSGYPANPLRVRR
jgi:hypothetical protein